MLTRTGPLFLLLNEFRFQDVDRLLGETCAHLNGELPSRVAYALCQALVAAVVHVILDGGPHRLFTQDDVPLLHTDMQEVQTLFYADGAGVAAEDVDVLCAPLAKVLETMGLDTPFIVQNLRQVGGRDSNWV
jgi:hypothetical protein